PTSTHLGTITVVSVVSIIIGRVRFVTHPPVFPVLHFMTAFAFFESSFSFFQLVFAFFLLFHSFMHTIMVIRRKESMSVTHVRRIRTTTTSSASSFFYLVISRIFSLP